MQVLEHSLEYLEKTIEGFQIDKRSRSFKLFTCPICLSKDSAKFANKFTFDISCIKCGKILGNIVDIICEKEGISKDDAEQKIKDTLNLKIITEKERKAIFNFFEQQKFNLVPIAANSKIPIEKDWVNKEHRDKKEWLQWYEDGINFGIKRRGHNARD